MSENSGIRKEELSICWNQLHDIEEIVRDTPFALEKADMDRVRKNIREADERFSDNSVPVKIVVTGGMKAGKSMMADVLFFGGEGVLNSEATPATANITYIRCTDEQHKEEGAKVCFLKSEDVKQMENYLAKQREDGKSDDANAIVDKVKLRETEKLLAKINVDPVQRDCLLNTEKWIERNKLKEYSDAGGEFSDYVDHIELYIDDERLKGLEIVDTPGLGDPVASRSQKARDESRGAEVVFYLSCARQFMTMEDSDEFARLKKAGCKNIVLIMSQFDQVFEPDDEEEISDLRDTFIYDQIVEEGKERIKEALKRYGVEYEPVEIIPICALGEKLSLCTLKKDDAYYRRQVAKLFPDLSNRDVVSEISGIRDLQEERERVVREKERIRDEFNMEILRKCQSEVLHVYQSLHKRIENDIAMKKAILESPDVANKASNALSQWKQSLNVTIDKAMGKICTKIDAECGEYEGIGKELNNSARAARENMDKATSPDSLNGAYEYTFRNAVALMFAEGLEKRMCFDDGKETYGQMFQSFKNDLYESEVPVEVEAIKVLKNKVFNSLQNTFEARIHENYRRTLKKALPKDNINTILNDNYKTVLENSPDFKYKSNPRKKRAEQNANAIAKCKGAIDNAMGLIFDAVYNFSNNRIRELFSSIGEELKKQLKGEIDGAKMQLHEMDNEVHKKQIQQYNDYLEKLQQLRLAE